MPRRWHRGGRACVESGDAGEAVQHNLSFKTRHFHQAVGASCLAGSLVGNLAWAENSTSHPLTGLATPPERHVSLKVRFLIGKRCALKVPHLIEGDLLLASCDSRTSAPIVIQGIAGQHLRVEDPGSKLRCILSLCSSSGERLFWEPLSLVHVCFPQLNFFVPALLSVY